ncbi:hypothetical protein ANRL3_00518 [Anaerolineae bacterium]|nr:hypothetical protein ANRL3_00518 [Anaerolineae bacterium]
MRLFRVYHHFYGTWRIRCLLIKNDRRDNHLRLTHREREIAALVATGTSDKEITKTGTRSRTELAVRLCAPNMAQFSFLCDADIHLPRPQICE